MLYLMFCLFSFTLVSSISSYASNESNFLSNFDTILFVGGSGPGNYSTVQDAIDNASSGDTIFVFDDSSPYYENIDVNVPVSIVGENKKTTIVDGLSRYHVFSIYANEVSISNLTVQYGGSGWSNVGIYIAGTDVLIENNIIQNNANGVFIESASFNHILNNTFRWNIYHAIRMEYTANNKLLDNQVVENDNGIYMWESPGNIIVRNVLDSNNWAGIILGEYCDNNLIYHNNFISNNIEHAYDLSNNSWDAGYPVGGNYWDDYTGEDIDNDGIGDIPYIIRGPHAIDYFPLIDPYGPQIPDIAVDVHGGIGYTIMITDKRENSSQSVPVDIYLDFNYPIRERVSPGMSPSFQFHYDIKDNQQLIHSALPPYFFGIGNLDILVEVGPLSENVEKRVVGWLVFPRVQF
jgi:parallel beta-helix repeat protein